LYECQREGVIGRGFCMNIKTKGTGIDILSGEFKSGKRKHKPG
jgi:hypothetical protein